MTGDYHFGNGGHTYQVGSYGTEETHLGGSLVGRARSSEIHTLIQLDSHSCSNLKSLLLKLEVVGAGHIGEAGAEVVHISSYERIGHKVDMVADYDGISHLVVGIQGSGGIGDQQELDSELAHHADGQRQGGHIVSLVVVEAALHREHAFPSEISADEITLVAYYRGYGEAGDFGIGDGDPFFDYFCQLSQAAAQDDGCNGLATFEPGLDVLRSRVDSFNSFVHSVFT